MHQLEIKGVHSHFLKNPMGLLHLLFYLISPASFFSEFLLVANINWIFQWLFKYK